MEERQMTRKIDLEDEEIILLCKALQSKIKVVKKWIKVDKDKDNKYYYNKDLIEVGQYQDLFNKLYQELPEGSFLIRK